MISDGSSRGEQREPGGMIRDTMSVAPGQTVRRREGRDGVEEPYALRSPLTVTPTGRAPRGWRLRAPEVDRLGEVGGKPASRVRRMSSSIPNPVRAIAGQGFRNCRERIRSTPLPSGRPRSLMIRSKSPVAGRRPRRRRRTLPAVVTSWLSEAEQPREDREGARVVLDQKDAQGPRHGAAIGRRSPRTPPLRRGRPSRSAGSRGRSSLARDRRCGP